MIVSCQIQAVKIKALSPHREKTAFNERHRGPRNVGRVKEIQMKIIHSYKHLVLLNWGLQGRSWSYRIETMSPSMKEAFEMY